MKRTQGFTLLEMLVVLVLLATLSLGLFHALHFAGRNWSESTQRLQRLRADMAAADRMQDLLNSARSYSAYLPSSDLFQQRPWLLLDDDVLMITMPMFSYLSLAGAWQVRMQPGAESALELHLARLQSPDLLPVGQARIPPASLFTGGQGWQVRCLDDLGQWLSEWLQATSPRVCRLQWELASGPQLRLSLNAERRLW